MLQHKSLLLLKFERYHTWYRKNFPLKDSFIASDLILLVFLEKKMQVKDLFLSLPHSDTAVRIHFNRLLENDWIVLVGDHHDGRIKYVTPSEKLNKLFSSFLFNLEEIDSQLVSHSKQKIILNSPDLHDDF